MGTAYEVIEAVDFNDPETILMAREGDVNDETHEQWFARMHVARVSERDRSDRVESEPVTHRVWIEH